MTDTKFSRLIVIAGLAIGAVFLFIVAPYVALLAECLLRSACL